jgi:hypothetical protein
MDKRTDLLAVQRSCEDEKVNVKEEEKVDEHRLRSRAGCV